ncbi:MAG: acetate--CoA ligase family protein [Alphaproteobacteria bacterium]
MAQRSLQALMRPNSIAVIGASEKANVAGRVFRNLLRSGFAGGLYPVHPGHGRVHDKTCYPDLKSVPEVPDCVVLAMPFAGVLEVLEETAAKGAPAAVVLAEGFADAGNDQGRERQRRLVGIAKAADMAVLGPNCMGLTSLRYGFANSFANLPDGIEAGAVSVVSQSGGLLNAVVELGHNRRLGFNYLISSGNGAVTDIADMIDYLAGDSATRVICAIVEGVGDGRKFRRAVARGVRAKPVIILKLGASGPGARAVHAHTGVLAGSDAAYKAVCRENGVAAVDSIDAMVETAHIFSRLPLPKGDRTFLFSVSGGATVLAGDLGAAAGLEFPPIGEDTNRALQQILGVDHPFHNPMDVVGAPRLAAGDNLTRCLDVVMGDDDIDLVALVKVMQRDVSPSHQTMIDQARAAARTAAKPLLMISEVTWHWRDAPDPDGLVIAETLGEGLAAVARLHDYARFRRDAEPLTEPVPSGGIEVGDIPARATLTEYESKLILARAGLAVTREGLAASAAHAVRIAKDIGYPVALKLQSPELPHKAEAGGVALGIHTPTELRRAYKDMMARVSASHPTAEIDGVLVQEMVADGLEFILGMSNDDQFGPLVVCGTGGVLVELVGDRSVRFPPLTATGAGDMLDELKGAKMLEGTGGAAPRDREALVDAIVTFAGFVDATDGKFAAIDINPLMVLAAGKGVKVADALIIPA